MNSELEKDKKLEKIIELLCKEQNLYDLKDRIIETLKDVYQGEEYRHQYSKITTIILNSTKDKEQAFMTLTQNIRLFAEIIDKENNLENIKPQLRKLYDHINLECIRLQDSDNKINRIKDASKNLDKRYRKLKDNLNKQQTQYIVILGIFASIVLAFVGGLVFSTSVLSNIDKASIYRLAFVMAFIALFFGNILYFLFNFLSKLSLLKNDNTENNKNEKWYNKLIIWFNIMLFAILAFNYIVLICSKDLELKHKATANVPLEVDVSVVKQIDTKQK